MALDSESLLPAPQTEPGNYCADCGRRIFYAFPRGADLRTTSPIVLDAEAPCFKVTAKEMWAEPAYAFVLHKEFCRRRREPSLDEELGA